jgi:hypothetical protein
VLRVSALVLFGLIPGAFGAEGRTAVLSWVRLPGAESCLGAGPLAHAVDDRLGRAAFVLPTEGKLFIEGHIAPSPRGTGFQATILLRDESGKNLGTRALDTRSSSCRELDEAIALVVALMIDPNAAARPAPTAPAPLPAPAPAPPPQAEPTKVEAREGWEKVARLRAGALAGLLPQVVATTSVSVEVIPAQFLGVQISAVLVPASSLAKGVEGAVVSLAAGGLSVCPLHLGAWRFSFSACAGVSLGALTGWGVGFPTNASVTHFYASGGGAGRVSYLLGGPFTLELQASADAPFTQPEFLYGASSGQTALLFRSWPVLAGIELGLGAALP